jgi:DNA-binding transcriptional MerR regulator
MALWFTNYNMRETSRELGVPLTTVKEIVDKNKNAEEFEELRTQTEKAFAQKTTEIIEKGLILLNKRLNRAIEHEDDLDELIEEIWDIDDDEMSYKEKDKLVNKIKTLQLQNIKDITTAIGTLYDKRALSRGDMTQNIGFATNLDINKLAEISGFKKDADAE